MDFLNPNDAEKGMVEKIFLRKEFNSAATRRLREHFELMKIP